MGKIRSLFLKRPVLLALIAFIIGYAGINSIPIYNDVALRVVLSIMMLAIMWFFGTKGNLRFDFTAFKDAIKRGRYAILISCVFFAIQFVPMVMSLRSHGLPENWLFNFLRVIALCIFVGIFEETLFRGIIFNSLLPKRGETHRGIMVALLISSLIFGFVHVSSYFLFGGEFTALGLGQAFFKTLQTGMLGFLLGAILLKTKSIWGISAIHAIGDILLLTGSVFINLQMDTTSGASYISGDKMGYILLGVYIITCILSIPFIISAKNMVYSLELPERGIFYEEESLELQN